MKKIKLLPSIIMLALCLCVLGIGVYSATTGSNTISGTLTVNSAGYEVEIAVYKGTDSAHGSLIGPTNTNIKKNELNGKKCQITHFFVKIIMKDLYFL